ncbi:transmembrane protein 136-like [Anoplophora glabripennis]|uniref:transmembrane protein 136-like n=1 Tax=Anoplophora glabripennis TaxID=217634 RepID=UPI0008752169|nr:transmembrane protein 136-like [Anoplophora glabripennis]
MSENLTTTIATKQGHINYESLFAVVVSTAVWRFGYTIISLVLPRKSPEYCCRIITFIHGLLVAFIGINQCFLIDSPFDHPEWRTSYMQSFVLVASLGYFIHDLEWCFRYQREDKLMIAHHIYSVFALFRMLFKGYSGAQATCALGSMEITNPFLQMRWFIRSEGMYPSALFTSVEITFIIVFVAIRILLGTYYMYIIFKQPKNDWDFVALSFTIYVVSWMFMFNIVKYLFTKYFGLKRKNPDVRKQPS